MIDVKDAYERMRSVCTAWRNEAGVKIKDIADCAGVTVQAVYDFEKGISRSMLLYITYLSMSRCDLRIAMSLYVDMDGDDDGEAEADSEAEA